MTQSFWQVTFLNNTVKQYVLFAIVLVAGMLTALVLKHVFLKRGRKWAERNASPAKANGIDLLEKYLMPAVYIFVFYISVRVLTLNGIASRVFRLITLAGIIVFAAIFASKLLVFLFAKYWEKKKNQENETLVRWVGMAIQTAVWVAAFLLFADNAGIKLTSVITGLGLGGIVLAFAAQEVLKDIFCYFSIVFDRPFETGDFISVEQYSGNVEHIGIKTTRLRSLSGEELIFSNKDLTDSRVKNFRSLEARRVLFELNISYETSNEKLQMIPQLVQEVIDRQKDTRFERAYFMRFGEYSLIYEVAYYVYSKDYEKYVEIQQVINFGIKESFEAQGIEFAYREAGPWSSLSKKV
ncbi:MAG: mechanosensitive ion channel family protein [Eubacteriaceae bacterium]|nr:mechanosensitive ion channel family protein [Eubacteriaceae bacterium]